MSIHTAVVFLLMKSLNPLFFFSKLKKCIPFKHRFPIPSFLHKFLSIRHYLCLFYHPLFLSLTHHFLVPDASLSPSLPLALTPSIVLDASLSHSLTYIPSPPRQSLFLFLYPCTYNICSAAFNELSLLLVYSMYNIQGARLFYSAWYEKCSKCHCQVIHINM